MLKTMGELINWKTEKLIRKGVFKFGVESITFKNPEEPIPVLV